MGGGTSPGSGSISEADGDGGGREEKNPGGGEGAVAVAWGIGKEVAGSGDLEAIECSQILREATINNRWRKSKDEP